MRRAFLALLLSLALALVACAPRASAAIPKPRYAAGDFWTYAMSLEQGFGLTFYGNMTMTAGDVRSVDVQGEALQALEMSVEGGGRFNGTFNETLEIAGTWAVTGTEDWETTAWHPVRSFVVLTADATFAGPPPVSMSFRFVNETTRRITEDAFPWPIAAGASGEVRAHWNITQNVTVQFTGYPPESNETRISADLVTDLAHTGAARITVLAGAFDADRIEETGPEGVRAVRWYAARVGNDVLEEDYNDTGGKVSSLELRSFRYRAGEPTPSFPWLYVIVAVLAVVAVILFGALVLRGRKREPAEVWMPPEKESPPKPGASP